MYTIKRRQNKTLPSIAVVHSIEEELIMSNTKKEIKKIVLAYSGGLDTSVNYPLVKGKLSRCRSHCCLCQTSASRMTLNH